MTASFLAHTVWFYCLPSTAFEQMYIIRYDMVIIQGPTVAYITVGVDEC